MNKNYQKTNEDVNDFILGNPTTSKAKATENLVKVIDILLKSNISRVLCEVILQKTFKTYSPYLTEFNFSQVKEIFWEKFLKFNVNQLNTKFQFININNTLMIYDSDSGSYTESNDSQVIQFILKENSNISVKESKEILDNLKALSYQEFNFLNNYKTLNLVHCKNGMLEISSDGFYLLPHDAKYGSTSCLNAEFESEASCPTWISFLSEAFELYDNEQHIAINLLKEFMGYSLIHGNSLQKMLCITGKPRTGKSIIADIIHQILGVENTSSIPFDELNDPNKISALIGKLANINGELAKHKQIDSSKIKSLIGEDILTYKKLYQNPGQFKNEAKLISIGNYLPAFKETTNAMLERMLVLNLDNVVPEAKRDPFLKEKLKAEKNGIFLWCLEGLISLNARGHFIEPNNSLKSKEDINHLSNSIIYWLNESEGFIFDEDNRVIPFKNIYQFYKDFCKENGINAEKRFVFKETLEDIEYLRVYRDVRLNKDVVELVHTQTEANA
ncbi:phage/plasmid primase, P4 family [Cetobacterium somerae]|uniref:DNA primase family protein n=2 Tax=Cetobacterium somerae TaxID=188913 RepID=UPI00389195C2